MELFDDVVRADVSPAKASEDSFSFLNRAAGPAADAVPRDDRRCNLRDAVLGLLARPAQRVENSAHY
jgi:hypothetical protein